VAFGLSGAVVESDLVAVGVGEGECPTEGAVDRLTGLPAERGVERARRAGTAKTSLYRRWSNPEELLLEAIAAAYPVETPSPAADDLRGDLIRALQLLVEWSRHPSARAVQAVDQTDRSLSWVASRRWH
jgi:hypothetical protein